MLVSLNVTNFAIIDNIQIDFKAGMNVLTGETGAGKSIIIDAIGLLFGNRADSSMIRFNESKATVEGIFTDLSSELKKYLEELGIELLEDDAIVIKREIYSTGKSVCRVNNTIITLNQLLTISEHIGDIHSQQDTIGLINQKNYLNLISTPEIDKLLSEYLILLGEYNKRKHDYEELLNKNNTLRDKVDFLEFQLKEFERAGISVTEEEELKQELQYLSNYEHIISNITKINEIFYDDDVLGKLYSSISYLDKLSKFDPKFEEIKKSIEDSYYTIEEALDSNVLKSKTSDFDLNRIDEINARLSVYSDLKRKHRKETKEIIEYFENIKKELELVENYSFHLEELKKLQDEAYINALNCAKHIREKRIEISQKITESVKLHLKDLQIKNAQFEIVFNELTDNIILKNDGIDTIDFLVSFNKGEPLKPLSKIASGGEMSRFMLALKTVMNVKLQSLMIFDEIDSGVSGTVAHSIGEKIKSISKISQVLCITHLPQVAALADTHFKIYKIIENNQTYTRVKNLNYDERVQEIASMISNENITEASINLAKELISTATNF